jgi:hypothetical protein
MGIRPRSRLINAGAGDELIVDVVADPAEAHVAVGEPRTGDSFQQVEDLLPIVKGIEQRGEPAQIQEKGGPPEQMAGDAVQFGP